MKKSLLTLAVATMCLSGCGKNEDGIKSKKIDGKEVIAMVGNTPIYADDIADQLLYNAEGAELIYSELTKLVTKLAYPAAEDIKASAEVQLSQWKDEVKSTASTNGTTYDDELDAALAKEGVASLNELEKKFQYDLQRKKLENKYWEDNEAAYYESYVNTALPYHVSHYLLSLGEVSNNYFAETLTETEAKKLSYLLEDLADPAQSFASIASDAVNGSADTGSAAKGGDLGIMDLYTSFVSEFKYSVYMADYYLHQYEENFFESAPAIYQTIVNTLKDSEYYANGATYIPYSITKTFKDNADKVATSSNSQIQSKSAYRYTSANIIFQNYFNNPGLSFIEYDDGVPTNAVKGVDYVEVKVGPNEADVKKVLAKDGKVVLLTRSSGLDSSSGIHFILIEHSPLVEDAAKYFSNDDADEEYTSYVEYYGKDKKEATQDSLETNVKTAIELGNAGTTDNLNIDLFQKYYLANEADITIADDIKTLLGNYLNTKEAIAKEVAEENVLNSVNQYALRLDTFEYYYTPAHYVPVDCIDAKYNDEKACIWNNTLKIYENRKESE